MVKTLKSFEKTYSDVIEESKRDITNELIVKAKRLRLDIAKVRIQADKIRKTQKEEYLRAGKAIDGVNNILKWAIIEKEEKLSDIEKHFEIQEKKRLEDLHKKRLAELSPYLSETDLMVERRFSDMDDDVWNAYFSAKKKEHEDRLEAEKRAENERVEREKKQREEQERIRK